MVDRGGPDLAEPGSLLPKNRTESLQKETLVRNKTLCPMHPQKESGWELQVLWKAGGGVGVKTKRLTQYTEQLDLRSSP